jgi:hypothetical protein
MPLEMQAPQVPDALLRGSPFTSIQHRQWADQARAGRIPYPAAVNEAVPGIPAGTIGLLIYDAPKNVPLSQFPVKLKVVHESIAEGTSTNYLDAITDEVGRAGFTHQPTDSAYRYEVQVEYQGAKYSSGPFQLKRDVGHVAALRVYPSTQDLNETFIATRALYVVVPRDDVFECQAIVRFHNASPVTWLTKAIDLRMPKGTKAFRGPADHGDLEARFANGVVTVNGAVPPGQTELSFTFQLPNPRLSEINFDFPAPPYLIDARVYAEVSSTASLTVSGFEAPQDVKGKEGQRALLTNKDFLSAEAPPSNIQARLSGLPTRGYGSWVGALIAATIALLGVSYAFTGRRGGLNNNADRSQARSLLLDELVALEQARNATEIGPKTYEQAKRTLLDALARLEADAG